MRVLDRHAVGARTVTQKLLFGARESIAYVGHGRIQVKAPVRQYVRALLLMLFLYGQVAATNRHAQRAFVVWIHVDQSRFDAAVALV